MPWDEALIEAVVRHYAEKSGEAGPRKFAPLAEHETARLPKPAKRGFFAALRRN